MPSSDLISANVEYRDTYCWFCAEVDCRAVVGEVVLGQVHQSGILELDTQQWATMKQALNPVDCVVRLECPSLSAIVSEDKMRMQIRFSDRASDQLFAPAPGIQIALRQGILVSLTADRSAVEAVVS